MRMEPRINYDESSRAKRTTDFRLIAHVRVLYKLFEYIVLRIRWTVHSLKNNMVFESIAEEHVLTARDTRTSKSASVDCQLWVTKGIRPD